MSEHGTSEAPVAARPSATVLLLRDRPHGGVEVHLQRRHAEMGFGADAHVFPGGSVDAGDAERGALALFAGQDLGPVAARMCLDGPDESPLCAAIHLCAFREVFEEASILLSRPHPHPDAAREARAHVLAGGAFCDVIPRLGVTLDAGSLTYVAHFVTPTGVSRRFDTRFFLAHVPEGQVASIHEAEAASGGWWTPAEMLELADTGRARLMPPTRILLSEMTRHASAGDAIHALGTRPVARVLFSMQSLSRPLPDHLPSPEEVEAMEAAR